MSEMNDSENKPNLSQLLTTSRQRLMSPSPAEWREVVYTPEIDGLLAELALDSGDEDVSETAARAVGRIRSEAAVRVLAEQQQKGNRRALRALALVRDEAPSLPNSVSRQARLYTWLSNTWRRISDDPARIFARYLLAALFSGIAMWWYAYSELPTSELFSPERWGRSLTTGITFGVIFGLVVVLAAEIPERLRGFWPWWSRLVLNLVLGLLSGTLVWVVVAWFFLFYKPVAEDFDAILLGALGAGAAFSLGVIFRIPGWLGAIWAAVMLYIPLYVTWEQRMPPLIYTRPDEHINDYAIVIVALIAIGAYLPQITGDVRKLWQRLRSQPASTQPPPPSEPASASA